MQLLKLTNALRITEKGATDSHYTKREGKCNPTEKPNTFNPKCVREIVMPGMPRPIGNYLKAN